MKKSAFITTKLRATPSLIDKISDTVPSSAIYNNASSSNVIIDLNEIDVLLNDSEEFKAENLQPLNTLFEAITNGTNFEAMVLAGIDQLEVYL